MEDRWGKLTAAERRVVELACEGLTNRGIAERLSISPRTVQRHLYEIFRKLGVSSRTALVAGAVRRELRQSDEAPEGPVTKDEPSGPQGSNLTHTNQDRQSDDRRLR